MKYSTFLLVLGAFLCLNLSAQNVQPTLTDPEELAAAQQQKEEVFKQLFQDPTNLSLLFK